MALPPTTSHTFVTPPAAPVTSTFPSWLNPMLWIPLRWPVNVVSSLPVEGSHKRIGASKDSATSVLPVATVLLSGLNATAADPRWPVNEAMTSPLLVLRSETVIVPPERTPIDSPSTVVTSRLPSK